MVLRISIAPGGHFVGTGPDGAFLAGGADIKRSGITGRRIHGPGYSRFYGSETRFQLRMCRWPFRQRRRSSRSFVDDSDIKGAVYLNGGFGARGMVSFRGATIGKDLDCTGGDFLGYGVSLCPKCIGRPRGGLLFFNEELRNRCPVFGRRRRRLR